MASAAAREEMSAPSKSARLAPGQPQPSLVNQRRGLKCVTGSLASHFVRGQFTQFLLNQRQEFLSGRGVAAIHGIKHVCDVADKK